jgi:hypothetical protein
MASVNTPSRDTIPLKDLVRRLLVILVISSLFYIVNSRDAPDIRPDNLAFFDIQYPAGYQIALPDIW